MSEFLLFRLYGAMASWGEIAVGEYRPTSDHPSRSAMIGLISAAFGIKRDKQKSLDAVDEGYRLAFRMDSPGILVRDYHTSQVPASGSGKNAKVFLTRKEELESPEDTISTILSSRDYRCEALATVCLEPTASAPYTLTEIAEQLRNPAFVLYLGRKSCPPCSPLSPIIVNAPDARGAFFKFDQKVPKIEHLENSRQPARIFWEQGITSGLSPDLSMNRRDNPGARSRWQFNNRTEFSAEYSAPR
jgi:CRISPR system Cascade subunit CasD